MPVYYAGGENIDRFRGTTSTPPRPEDWIGATTALPEMILPPDAPRDSGVSRLPDGRSLRDAVRDDRTGWLGPDLAGRFSGGETGLLVKLLDAGERLPVHAHPDRAFARERLGSPFGKTEGWIVMDDAPGGDVWLGFREDVALDRLQRWIEAQAVDEMLAAMNRLPARPGSVFYVPAGVPHAIGPGVMITELQEPTSFSILAEFKAFGLDATQATLGLGWADAIGCFDRSGYPAERLARLAATAARRRGNGDVPRIAALRRRGRAVLPGAAGGHHRPLDDAAVLRDPDRRDRLRRAGDCARAKRRSLPATRGSSRSQPRRLP